MSSTAPSRHRPRSTAGVRKGAGGPDGAAMARNPLRRASFTIALRLWPRARRIRSARAATSGSSVSVVRMHLNISSVMP